MPTRRTPQHLLLPIESRILAPVTPCRGQTLLLCQVSATKERLLKILYRYLIFSCPRAFAHGMNPTLPNFREISSSENILSTFLL